RREQLVQLLGDDALHVGPGHDLRHFGDDQRLHDALLQRALAMPAAPVRRPALAVEAIPVRLVGGSARPTAALVRRATGGTGDEVAERIPACRGAGLALI